MSKSNEHTKLINGAAKTILRPLGFQQKGQSRLWFADRGYWALIVEFQPSGFSKGSYLNICAMWFWHPADQWIFHHFQRAGEFVSFENLEQFRGEANRLANFAAESANQLARTFGALKDIADYFKEDSRNSPNSLWHAAIVTGLAGDWAFSRSCFDELFAKYQTHPWWQDKESELVSLRKLLGDNAAFQAAIRETVSRTRAALHLPLLPPSWQLPL